MFSDHDDMSETYEKNAGGRGKAKNEEWIKYHISFLHACRRRRCSASRWKRERCKEKFDGKILDSAENFFLSIEYFNSVSGVFQFSCSSDVLHYTPFASSHIRSIHSCGIYGEAVSNIEVVSENFLFAPTFIFHFSSKRKKEVVSAMKRSFHSSNIYMLSYTLLFIKRDTEMRQKKGFLPFLTFFFAFCFADATMKMICVMCAGNM